MASFRLARAYIGAVVHSHIAAGVLVRSVQVLGVFHEQGSHVVQHVRHAGDVLVGSFDDGEQALRRSPFPVGDLGLVGAGSELVVFHERQC